MGTGTSGSFGTGTGGTVGTGTGGATVGTGGRFGVGTWASATPAGRATAAASTTADERRSKRWCIDTPLSEEAHSRPRRRANSTSV